MFAVEYTSKYHNQLLGIPFRTKEEAEAVYNLIKEKMGKDPYQLDKDKQSVTVEFSYEDGPTTVDTSVIAAVWVIDTNSPVTNDYRKEIARLRKEANEDLK